MSKPYRDYNYIHGQGNQIAFNLLINDDMDENNLDCEIDNPQGILFFVNASLNGRESEEFGRFRFSTIQGIGTAILVSSDTFVTERWRRTIWSEKFRWMKADVARELGCSLMIATADASNVPAYKNLLKSGYKISNTIINKQTGHPVSFGTKAL